jgi:hypothetical protein
MSIPLTAPTANPVTGCRSIRVGTQLTKDLNVGAALDRNSSLNELVTKYQINRKLHVEATASSESGAADAFYSFEFDLQESPSSPLLLRPEMRARNLLGRLRETRRRVGCAP